MKTFQSGKVISVELGRRQFVDFVDDLVRLDVGTPGARLIKIYNITIQGYRNSHAKMQDSKCIFCGVGVQNLVWNFKGHTKLWTHTTQNRHFARWQKFWRLMIYWGHYILSLSEAGLKEQWSQRPVATGTLDTLRPIYNGRHFLDDIFKSIFLNDNVWISIEMSLKFVPEGQINNILALVQINDWRQPGYKPLSEAMMVRLLTHQ